MNSNTPFTLAIASGKGGTGKTTVASNMAAVIGRSGLKVNYLDCDVEEPNGHIFIQPQWRKKYDVNKLIPKVNETTCIHCSKCSQICQYAAIMDMGSRVMVFPDLCHACGGCYLVCPVHAISEVPENLGYIQVGYAGNVRFVHGLLNIGQAMAPPLIKQVKREQTDDAVNIIDAPPGTSCPVIEAVSDVDFVILVTEPTPFGLNDLKLAVDMLLLLKIPFGVVVNRAGMGNREVYEYCRTKRVDILFEIPDDRRIAESYSRGVMMVDAMPELSDGFIELFEKTKNGSRS